MKKLFLGVFLLCILKSLSYGQVFHVSYAAGVMDHPFNGRVLLYLSKSGNNPLNASVGLESFPCFAVEADNIKVGQSVNIDDKATSFPVKLSEIERGNYYVQVVYDQNTGEKSIPLNPGNVYSVPQKINIEKDINQVYQIVATKRIPEQVFGETKFTKEFKITSNLLSRFHHKNTTITAGVILPKEYYTEPERKFPVLFYILA